MATAGPSSGEPRRRAVSGEAELVAEFAPIAYAIARDFYLLGGDADDLRQEALVGLVKGLRSFDPDRGVPLDRFLALTIRRQVLTAVTMARREKHRPLNEALRVVVLEREEVDAVDLAADEIGPHETLVLREQVRALVAAMRTLSELERRSLAIAHRGEQYAYKDERRDKSVENGIDRARRKLRAAADIEEAA